MNASESTARWSVPSRRQCDCATRHQKFGGNGELVVVVVVLLLLPVWDVVVHF